MTLLHISCERGYGVTHDDRETRAIIVNIEIVGLALALWIGVRR